MIDAFLGLHTPLNPLRGDGYQAWSGILSGGPWVAGIGMFWHRHNCHQPRCLRVVRHGNTHCPRHRQEA